MARVLQKKFSRQVLLQLRKCERHFSNPILKSLSADISVRHYSPKWDVSKEESFIVSSLHELTHLEGVTIPEFIWNRLPKHENTDGFKCALTGRKYTHGQIYKASRSFATALIQSGLKRRDIVAIALPNMPEFPITYLGIWEAGLISSAMNPAFTSYEYARQLQNCEAKAIVTIPQFLPAIREAQKECPNLKSIIIIGEAQVGCHSFFEMIKVDSSSAEFLKGSQIDTTQEIANLPYSSGTTGLPKGVSITHSNFITILRQFSHPSVRLSNFNEDGNEQERFIGLLPFCHAYSLMLIMSLALYQGSSVSCLPRFKVDTFIKAIREHKPTIMHLVPPLISFMVDSPEIGSKEMEPIKGIMGAGARISPSLINKIFEKAGAGKTFFFQERYGMTETTGCSLALPKEFSNIKIGSCGAVFPGTLAKIINTDTGEALGPNENGELCLKGPQVMKGYWKNDKATRETIDENQWLHTGDIAYYDKDNCFYIVDRLKELIKVKGLQVAPSELENILRKHPAVADVAVIGIPDEKWGEFPRAYIVKREDSVQAHDLHDFINPKVSAHKKLKGGIQFVETIPKALSGKILRKDLKQNFLRNGI